MAKSEHDNEGAATAAAEAINAMAASRARLGQRARWSLYRHAGFGLIMGSLVASFSLPGGWSLVVVVLCLLFTWAIVQRDRSRDGFFINGYRRGNTRGLTVGLLILSLLGLAAGAVARIRLGIVWAPALLGVLVVILCTAGSKMWEHLYLQELGDRHN